MRHFCFFSRIGCTTGALLLLWVVLPLAALGNEELAASIDTGDTAWMLTSTLLVIMMTAPALALFYGGLVSQRNVLSTLMHSFFALCLITVQWVLWGYSFAFGTGFRDTFIGGTSVDLIICFSMVLALSHLAPYRICSLPHFRNLCGYYSGVDFRIVCGTDQFWSVCDICFTVDNIHL